MLIIESAHAGAPVAEEDWLSEAWSPEQRNSSLFFVSAWNFIIVSAHNFFFPHLIYLFIFSNLIFFFFLVCAGPQVPSVAVYSTEDKQSEWPDLWHSRVSVNVAISLQTNSAHSVWLQRCSAWRQTRRWMRPTAACRCPKWRTRPSSSTTTVRTGTHLQLSHQVEELHVSYGPSVCCSSDHADPEAGWLCGHSSLPPTAARVSVNTCGLPKIDAQCEKEQIPVSLNCYSQI